MLRLRCCPNQKHSHIRPLRRWVADLPLRIHSNAPYFPSKKCSQNVFFLSRHCAMHTLCTHCQKWMSLYLNSFPRSVLSSHSLSSWCLPFIPMPCNNLTFHLSEKRKHSIPFINYQVVTNTADHCLPSCDHPFATLVTWYYFIFLGQHIRDLEKVINHYSEATDHTG